MGVYAVTGGTKGIGFDAVKALSGWGHDVINIDIDNGDICADLGTPRGRRTVIDELHRRCVDGLDGFLSNAGIVLAKKPSTVLSVNYFGAVTVAEGVYDLLKKKRGSCVFTASGSIVYAKRDMYFVDELLTNCGDEERIGRLVDSFDPLQAKNAIYASTKIAIVRWVRRTAPSWIKNGVTLNAIAPGAVATSILGSPDGVRGDDETMIALPMPMVYWQREVMQTSDLGSVLAFLALPEAKGCIGSVVYCDGGTSSLLDHEKFY